MMLDMEDEDGFSLAKPNKLDARANTNKFTLGQQHQLGDQSKFEHGKTYNTH